jgi:DegV family protein with EDD domain
VSAIAIITDTDSSLPAELAARHGIRQVPISIHFGTDTLHTGLDVDDASLFARVDREVKMPTTSAPAPGQFVEAFQAAFDSGASAIVCITVSSALSAVYQAALAAADLLPGRDITVIDSRTVTMGQGFMVLAAAEAAAAGATKEEVVERALAVGGRTHFFGALATMKYLAMSGRVGHLTAGFGGLLDVRPILTVRDGKLEMLERVRTRKKAWARLMELSATTLQGRPMERMAIVHVRAPEDAQKFCEELCAVLPCPAEVITAELTPGLSVHTGAGLIGVGLQVGA